MGQKGHIMVQKGLYMHEKKVKKIEFSDLKTMFFSGIFLSGIGGVPPPLTENHCAQKSSAERGGYPHPPLTEKTR